MSRCKGCGAEIEWQCMKSGKMMPVAPEPVFVAAGGNQVFITDEGETIMGSATEENTGEVAFVPHWANCPAKVDLRIGGKYGTDQSERHFYRLSDR